MRRSFRTLLLGLAALLALAPAAGGAAIRSPQLWATVNVCDTIRHPDTIGIRASMPGSSFGAREQMYMRFQVQYFRASDNRWHNITNGGDSGFISVGPAKYRVRQAGRLFVFAPPAGGSFELRGRVLFQWRRGGRVKRHAVRLTTAGHTSTAGADPRGYSSDACVIS